MSGFAIISMTTTLLEPGAMSSTLTGSDIGPGGVTSPSISDPRASPPVAASPCGGAVTKMSIAVSSPMLEMVSLSVKSSPGGTCTGSTPVTCSDGPRPRTSTVMGTTAVTSLPICTSTIDRCTLTVQRPIATPVFIATGTWTSGKTGSPLTTMAFNHGLPGNSGGAIVAIGLALFAYSTLIGWSYYGEKCTEYLLGEKSIVPYRVVFCLMVGVGAVVKVDLVWAFADAMNGLMAVPNLVALLLLHREVAADSRRYLQAKGL